MTPKFLNFPKITDLLFTANTKVHRRAKKQKIPDPMERHPSTARPTTIKAILHRHPLIHKLRLNGAETTIMITINTLQPLMAIIISRLITKAHVSYRDKDIINYFHYFTNRNMAKLNNKKIN